MVCANTTNETPAKTVTERVMIMETLFCTLYSDKSIFCLNPLPNVYSTTPVEVLLELLLLTRNPSLLVLKIYGKANFLKMLIDVDHDNLRTVLRQTPNTSHFYPF